MSYHGTNTAQKMKFSIKDFFSNVIQEQKSSAKFSNSKLKDS